MAVDVGKETENYIIVCAWCKKVKELDVWIVSTGDSDAEITHTICPECFEKEMVVEMAHTAQEQATKAALDAVDKAMKKPADKEPT